MVVTAPLMLPFDFGLKLTLIVHFALPAKLLPHGVAPLPTTAYSPLAEKPMVRAVLRLLVRVTVLAALVAPTAIVPKVRLMGDSEIAVSPIPDRFTTRGDPAALSSTVISPEMLPETEGLKVAVMVHLAPTAKVDGLIGQVVLLAKFPLAVIEFIVNLVVPLLVSVRAFPALVVFSS